MLWLGILLEEEKRKFSVRKEKVYQVSSYLKDIALVILLKEMRAVRNLRKEVLVFK